LLLFLAPADNRYWFCAVAVARLPQTVWLSRVLPAFMLGGSPGSRERSCQPPARLYCLLPVAGALLL